MANIVHLSPYYASLNAIHAGGVCMGKEIETLRQYNNVYKISFIQKKYDKDIYKREKDAQTYSVSLGMIDKIISVVSHFYMPVFFASRYSNKCKKYLKNLILSDKNIEFIHAEYAAMGQYFDFIRRLKKDIKIVYVLHDVTLQSYDRQYENAIGIIKKGYIAIQRALVKKHEKKWITQADHVMVFCDKDKEIIEERYDIASNKVKVINTYFELEKKEEKINEVTRKNTNELAFFFYGQLLREENREAAIRAIEIYKKYKIQSNKLTKMYLIGNVGNSELLNLQEEDIICTGFIEDVDKFIIENCDIALFPLKSGAGIKVKVLHCLALGIPVITSDVGAEGIDSIGQYIYLVKSDYEYIETMKRLEDEKLRRERRKENIEYINREFSWEKTINIFKEIYSNNDEK